MAEQASPSGSGSGRGRGRGGGGGGGSGRGRGGGGGSGRGGQQNQQNQQRRKEESGHGHGHGHSHEGRGISKEAPVPPESDVPFVDTHCHFDRIFENNRHQGSFADFRQKHPFPKNFGGAISIFCDPSAYSPSMGIWRDVIEEEGVYACFGIHPHNAKYYNDQVEERIHEAMQHPKALAWGECGLDYHYDNSPREVQREVFKRQIQQAIKLGKPLVVHSREAEEDTLYILQDNLPADWKVHMHCHSGTDEFTIALMKSFPNMAFGFTGAITFANASQKKKIAEVIPLERILLETDGPYMAPNPFRGQTAHPGHIPYIANQIALLKKRPLDEVYLTIRETTQRIYGI